MSRGTAPTMALITADLSRESLLSSATRLMIRHKSAMLNSLPYLLLLVIFASSACHCLSRSVSRSPILRSRPIPVRSAPGHFIPPFVHTGWQYAAYFLTGLELTVLALPAMLISTGLNEARAVISLNFLATITALTVALVSHRHHILAPNHFNLFLIAGPLIGGTQSILLFYIHELSWAGGLAAASCIVRLLLLILNDAFQSWYSDNSPGVCTSEELDINVSPTLSFFACLNPAFLSRLRSSSSLQDLPNLGSTFSSRLLHAQLLRKWRTAIQLRTNSLAIVCAKTWKGSVMVALLLRGALSGFSFAHAFLLHRVICALLQAELDTHGKLKLFILFVLTSLGRTMSKVASSNAANRLTTRVRGGLIVLLFEKQQNLTKANGENPPSLYIIRSDIEVISAGIPGLIKSLFTVIDTGLGVYFLSFFIDKSAVALLLPLATSSVFSIFFGDRLSASKRLWDESFAARRDKTSFMLSQLPATRMIGLARTATEYISRLHRAELKQYKAFQIIKCAANFSVAFSSIMTPVVLFVSAWFSHSLTAETAIAVFFPVLNIVSLHSNSVAAILHEDPNMTAILASFSRIQQFLFLEEREDPRIISAHANNAQHTTAVASSSQTATQKARDRPPNFLHFSLASIIPFGASSPIYTNINFSLHPGSITAVVGTRGSGKSTLLEAMLGETKIRDGSVYVGDDVIGFSGQCVWLQSLSVRDNVIGPHPFDIRRFKLVIRCCLLQEDLKKFPGGDSFIVGVGGSKLSNGQRQRLALARAVYPDPSMLLLDDAFSSLDRRTAASIIFRLCGKDGLLKVSGCTVVFATSLAEIADLADQFLLLNEKEHVIRFQPNDGKLKIAEFLRLQHVSASEAVEEKQRHTIHRVSKDATAGRAAAAAVIASTNSGNCALLAHVFRSMGPFNLIFICFLVSFFSCGVMLPGKYDRKVPLNVY
ncbi:ABC multidrug transporter [Cordyceps javanica]|uniref:ABC multidrug transporter n=1 Tax=Cordyceps javanica TaxID=43265 RepID=A0A545UZY2_9HYPO|nr:ABC multidrug transporter [Cordyceps javanica]